MVPRELALHFAIDANRINSRQRSPEMNRLEAWKQNGIISILIPETAHGEARAGNDMRRRLKTSGMVTTLNTHEAPSEAAVRHSIALILAPDGSPDRQTANDIDIVANAHKYGCILITADGGSRSQPGGILGNKDLLAKLGVQVMSDTEAVAFVEEKIRRRDTAELNLAQVQRRAPEAWVGKDL